MADRVDLAWAAGFVDGDGSIGFNHKELGHPYVSVSQANIDPLITLREIFGGSVIGHDDNRKSTYAPSYRWRVTTDRAVNVCRTLLPYLRVKRRQAEIILEWAATRVPRAERSHTPLPERIVSIRRTLIHELKRLNRKGVLRGRTMEV